MHTWGLFNKRYGFTQFVVRTRNTVSVQVADPNRPMVDKMLADEVARQGRLKAELAKNETTRPWLEEKRLFQNYKQLTFFDTLSLYFHLYHASERRDETYIHVPMTAESDSDVAVKKISDQVYSLDPFPFAGDTLKLTCRGRYVRPFADDVPADKVGATLASMIAIARSSGGNAHTTSTSFWMRKSVVPAKYPEIAPSTMPTTPEMITTMTAMTSEMRAP